jgi:hypothetical protein
VVWAVLLGCVFGCDVGGHVDADPWAIRLLTSADDTVPRWGPIRFQLDRSVSSWSVDRGSVHLSSGTVVEFVLPWFDPLTDQLVVDLARPMLPDAWYVARLSGLSDLDGVFLEPATQILLRAAEADPPVRPEVASVEAVMTLLAARCAGNGCHDSTTRAAGVDLGDRGGIGATALGRQSLQAASPNAAVDPDASGLLELPIIDDAGESTSVSRSYLVYKVLGDPHVLGERMPPPSAGPALSADDMQLLARWIMTGAPLK